RADLGHEGVSLAVVGEIGTDRDREAGLGGERRTGDVGAPGGIDGDGNAYVMGDTSSEQGSFPVRVGPDLTYNGSGDIFVAKVNRHGTGLVYAGYIGGDSFERLPGDIAVGSDGSAFVTGITTSTEATFPVKVGPDLTYNGNEDAFITKVNPAGTGLVYSGYIGGDSFELGFGVDVDANDNAYVAGFINIPPAVPVNAFPTVNGPDPTFNGGAFDGWVTKVSRSGASFVYSGFVGSEGTEYATGIAVDAAGNAYLTGVISGFFDNPVNFPRVRYPVPSFDNTMNGGADAFVVKVAQRRG
ncbi:MAG: hypothetical protein LC708_01250, partial [Actinobacteria bacterium]|nr:hypothetical protein [Actinomycetota bacterium]